MKISEIFEAKIDQALSDKLDLKANGADDVVLDGKMYTRSGPKNSSSKAGPWKIKRQMSFNSQAKFFGLTTHSNNPRNIKSEGYGAENKKYQEWIKACRKVAPDAQISGSETKAQMVDWTTKNNKVIGDWDGKKGVVYA